MQSRLKIMGDNADYKDAVDTVDTADMEDTADREDNADTAETVDTVETRDPEQMGDQPRCRAPYRSQRYGVDCRSTEMRSILQITEI